ncbi:hypoxanthine phosphoribosyltransferase [Sneathia sanguinegens]|uniref:Hypoxanthine phosphoribosyltransferase n=1 Tax=Sneathia sanguinegens TaxID=40543 RepID=A0ABT7HJ10_9FUSO|nr:hypoxanthine phosphoribosyltransferase [Sneathia sanguinegens]MDK9580134.1 hypoxanthine phosphoribosyltransferase [Sneathia sanguinegens]
MKHHVVELISEKEIAERIEELGKKISEDFKDEELILVALLRGSALFLADISRKITSNCRIDFMCVSSYGNGMETSGNINIKKDLDEDICNKNVLIIEDIIDTGTTLYKIKEFLLQRKPKSLKICTLLDKPSRRVHDVKIDYVGFTIPDVFIVGYGIDYAQQYRTLPYLAEVVKEDE